MRHADPRMAENDLSIRLLSEESFSQYREPWNRLLDASGSESFFLKWEWIYTFWKTIDRRRTSLLVCLCYHKSELVGLAPLYAYGCKFMGLPIWKVAFLGDRVASDYMDVFAKPGYEGGCCRAVLNLLRTNIPHAFSVIEFDAVCADSNLYRYLAADKGGRDDALVLPRFECPRAILTPLFDDYISRLSPGTRYDIRRKQRKLERKFAGLTIKHLDLSMHPEMLDVLFDLHADRWSMIKDRESTFYSSFRRRFNEELLRHLESHEGYFSCVAVDEKPVSIMYIFIYKKNAFFYQNGWNPAYAPYSIGIYTIQQAIRHAIDKGCKTFDFLRGSEAYKYKLCNDMRQAYAVLLFDAGFYGKTIRGIVMLKLMLKSALTRYGLLEAK